MDREHLISEVLVIAKEAADLIVDIFQKKKFTTKLKYDNSPVTDADLLANEWIEKRLLKIDPSIPILSEENEIVPYQKRSTWTKYWLVDPLDGTQEFLRGLNEFTINIALIENHIPVLGVVVAPLLKQYYWALKGGSAFYQNQNDNPIVIKTNDALKSPIKIALSRHHNHDDSKVLWKRFLERIGNYEVLQFGSTLKICLVARGVADLYPRLGPTGEWDTAAGQCILESAGGKLVDFRGQVLHYNMKASIINPGFFAVGPKELISILVDNFNMTTGLIKD